MKKVKEKETGYLPILYSIGFKPLQSWDVAARNGHIKRIFDEEIQSPAIELVGANVNNTYIYTPCDPSKSLDIKMPLIVLLIKNLRKFFSFEVEILDSKNMKRTFRASNFQTLTRVKGNFCSIPMKLEDGWNQVHIPLAEFTNKAFNTEYVHTIR